jgi:phosphoglycolate phosphatase
MSSGAAKSLDQEPLCGRFHDLESYAQVGGDAAHCDSVETTIYEDPLPLIGDSLSPRAIGMSGAREEWRQYVSMARRLILWDIDGTLITTGVIGRRALEDAAAEVAGLDAVPEVSMGGKTDPQIIAEILAASGVPDRLITGLVPNAVATAEILLAQGRSQMATEGRVHPGVRNVLERLDAIGNVRQSLLTVNVRVNAIVKVETFGLAGFFDFAVGAYGDDHANRDNLVPIALDRVARLRDERYSPSEVWIVGDTANDLRCARAGGVRCLLVGTGREGLSSLSCLSPDVLLPDLSDTETVVAVLLGT